MVQRIRVYEALARALAQAGRLPLFGVTGDANIYLVDSYVRRHGGRFVAAANENGAVLMALGHASVSGEVGLATVTHGPALTNTLTALAEGVKAGTPIVLLCGDTAQGDRENLQNISQRDAILATGAGFEPMNTPRTAVDDLARAIRRAHTERRPIAFNFLADQQHVDVEDEFRPMNAFSKPSVVPSGESLDNAVGIIAAARRPLVLAGRDAIDDEAREALLKLAARIEAPLATTLRAKGLFGGEDYDLGIMGTLSTPAAVEAIMASDCILAFGAGLNFHTTSHGAFVDGKRVIQVAPDASGIGRGHTPDVGLIGGIVETVEAFLYWLDEAEIPASGFRGELQSRGLASHSPAAAGAVAGERLDYVDVLRRLDEILPKDRVLVTDAGRHMVKAMQHLDVPSPRLYVQTASFGAIGLGMAQAIGAGAAEPGRPVVLTIGDGGFMLGGLTEFNTAVRHGTDLIVVLCNDSCYGAEYAILRDKQMDTSLSLFDWPDFAPIADALGGRGVTVRTLDDLDLVRQAVADRDRPLLIEIKLDPAYMPFW